MGGVAASGVMQHMCARMQELPDVSRVIPAWSVSLRDSRRHMKSCDRTCIESYTSVAVPMARAYVIQARSAHGVTTLGRLDGSAVALRRQASSSSGMRMIAQMETPPVPPTQPQPDAGWQYWRHPHVCWPPAVSHGYSNLTPPSLANGEPSWPAGALVLVLVLPRPKPSTAFHVCEILSQGN